MAKTAVVVVFETAAIALCSVRLVVQEDQINNWQLLLMSMWMQLAGFP